MLYFERYCILFREHHMILDVSWSLGEDYEQDYEELSCCAIAIPMIAQPHPEGAFKGLIDCVKHF